MVGGSSYKRRKHIYVYGYCLEGLFYSSAAVRRFLTFGRLFNDYDALILLIRVATKRS